MANLHPFDDTVSGYLAMLRKTLVLSTEQWHWIDRNLRALDALDPDARARFQSEGPIHWSWRITLAWGLLATLVRHPQARLMVPVIGLLAAFDLARWSWTLVAYLSH
ncbi:hypothetical protein [Ralstonia sp.]|uniref:hypothetical protein n=1 Tax=Ralstonia sp. TaxID=54061 RepID=UPI0031CFAF91